MSDDLPASDRSRKQAMTAVLERRVVNPVMRRVITSSHAPGALSLIETTGRRTGATRITPVGNGLVGDDTFWIVAEHGRRADYVRNLMAQPRVRVLVAGEWRDGTAEIIDDDDALARRRRLDAGHGAMGRMDGFFFRLSATDPLTIRVDLD